MSTDIAEKVWQAYHLADVHPEHPLRQAVAEIRRLRAEVAAPPALPAEKASAETATRHYSQGEADAAATRLLDALPAEKADEDRFFIDHDTVHDRVTGLHVHGDRSLDAYGVDRELAALNALARAALTALLDAPAPADDSLDDERVDLLIAAICDRWHGHYRPGEYGDSNATPPGATDELRAIVRAWAAEGTPR
ncbi:MAG: hypothetical protein WCK28_17000, partial [Burkholderiales bacterium]|jgi:hypothetical protein